MSVVDSLVEHGIYLVTTTDRMSVIGEYAGRERGRIVIVPGPLSPVSIPERKVATAIRLG